MTVQAAPWRSSCLGRAGAAHALSRSARTRCQPSQILGHLLSQYVPQNLFRDRLLRLGEIRSQRLVHHCLVPRSRLFGAGTKLGKHNVIDEDGNTTLSLFINDRAALAFPSQLPRGRDRYLSVSSFAKSTQFTAGLIAPMSTPMPSVATS